ncbi:MAG: hypothetical protein AB7O97_04065 [Planctomycetota bacterium]
MMHRTRRPFRSPPSLAAALLLLALPACATNRLFAPRENQNGQGPSGLPAAVYPLPAPARGEVRVWSDGADYDDADGATETRLHVGFELENTGDTPLRLGPDAVQVEAISAGGPATARLLPRGQESAAEALPGRTARVDFVYAIDGGTAPRAIEGFDVRWHVQAGELDYAQVTPFQKFFPEPRYPYYYHDPWPWFGAGFGYHWHCR